MKKEKHASFYNEVIKQGNSFCVRIPRSAMEYMGFEQGDIMDVVLKWPKEEKVPKTVLDIYRRNIKDIANFTDKDLKACLFVFAHSEMASDKLTEKEKQHVRTSFEKIIELEKGKEFVIKYRKFKANVTKENMLKVLEELKKCDIKELADMVKIEHKCLIEDRKNKN